MTNVHLPLHDAMPPRPITARWIVCGTLILESAMHLGGDGGGSVDMPVLRDPREGKPLLPGTTFAGALRSALADRLAGYGEEEPQAVAALFGSTRGDEEGSQSTLIVFDAFGELPPQFGIEIRDGVAISPSTGTAEEHKKYDFEVLPAGTRFPIRVDLVLPAPHGQDEKSLLALLATALDAFSHGEGSFGARRSRGLGRVQATWAARRFDLTTSEGWMEWLLSDHLEPIPRYPGQSCIRDVLEAAAPDTLRPIPVVGDQRKRIMITLNLLPRYDLLVRSPGTAPDGPDVSHLRSGGVPILPGTSLTGAMRAQALRIARLVREEQNDAACWIDRLFGPRFEGQRPPPGTTLAASRLRISEVKMIGSTPQRQTRIAIDRFTQGVVDGALFDELTEVGGAATVTIELRDPQEGELGLILLVVKDLLDGWLPVGGTSSVGRGVCRGSATVAFFDRDEAASRVAKIMPGRHPTGDAADEIDRAIRAFHNAIELESEIMRSRSDKPREVT